MAANLRLLGDPFVAMLQQCVEKRTICPSLAGFLFSEWDCETHNEVCQNWLSLCTK